MIPIFRKKDVKPGEKPDNRQAFAKCHEYLEQNGTLLIFPEGTRSRDGSPKKFATNGLKVITKYNKEGYIVPLTINNSWKVFKYGKFPLGLGSPITITTHKPIKINSLPFEELLEQTETAITTHIK